MDFKSFQINATGKRSVYIVWLRFLVFIAAITTAFIVFAPSFLLSFSKTSLPWNEESRILPPSQNLPGSPFADQPKLDDALRYNASPHLDGSPRGNLSFFISPDGIIKGLWNGEYDRTDEVHCTILAASFFGNIDPSKPCIVGKNRDTSKLYFITKGTFTILETGPSGRNSVNGFLYVCGWLDPNYTATGNLYVTENKKTFDTFSWSATPSN